MARTTKNPLITNRTQRMKLASQREPYWHLIVEGQHVGYRKLNDGNGSWIARLYTREHGRRFQALGNADDLVKADGEKVLTFQDAQMAAREWIARKQQEEMGSVQAGPYTVRQALDDYVQDRERATRKSLYRTRTVIKAHILPTLGETDVAKITHSKIKAWRDGLADRAPRARTKTDKEQAFRQFDASDAEAVRKRQATANRVLTILKAALNHAHSETKRIGSKAAWEGIRPFRNVDVAKVRFLTTDEITKLIKNCEHHFGLLVRGALLTGCRYGELARLTVEDYDHANETVFVRESKNGESRHIELSAEGAAFFAHLASGNDAGSLLFTRSNGKAWKQAEQKRPMDEACGAAEIAQVTFHILRHTYASHLAMNQTPLRVIADQLGHRDTRITERHYAHLGRAYVRETIRTRLPTFGLHTMPGLVKAS